MQAGLFPVGPGLHRFIRLKPTTSGHDDLKHNRAAEATAVSLLSAVPTAAYVSCNGDGRRGNSEVDDDAKHYDCGDGSEDGVDGANNLLRVVRTPAVAVV